ncbi:MAG TPA: glycosyltransferase, partial [Bacteroidia bacterium]|nr:glycosyltransferase [Bacteroidia bacterium]
MKISVITVCYNSVSTIEATILSVLQQSYATIEYIVVDGDSNDGTKSVLEKYRDKITKIVSEKDKGLYDALNKGIKLATGDVIAFLHADDFYTDPLVVEKYVKVFERGNYEAVYANLYDVDS